MAGTAIGATTGNGADIAAGSQLAENAVENNFLGPESLDILNQSQDDINSRQGDLEDAANVWQLNQDNQYSDQLLDKYRADPESLTSDERGALFAYMAQYYNEIQNTDGTEAANNAIENLLTEGSNFRTYSFPYALDDETQLAAADAWRESMDYYSDGNSSGKTRTKSNGEQAYDTAEAMILNNGYLNWQASMGDGAFALAGAGGAAGTTMRGIMYSAAGAHLGAGGVQLYNEDYMDAMTNLGFGLLYFSGAVEGSLLAKQPATTVTADLAGLGKTPVTLVDDAVGVNTKALPNEGATSTLESLYTNLKGDFSLNDAYCTGCAIELRNAAGGEGKIVIFSGKGALWPDKYEWTMGSDNFKIPASQAGEEFAYHSVYTDGKYIYDPFVSSNPIPQSDYLKMLNESNPGGFSWRIYDPEISDYSIPDLKKGGF